MCLDGAVALARANLGHSEQALAVTQVTPWLSPAGARTPAYAGSRCLAGPCSVPRCDHVRVSARKRNQLAGVGQRRTFGASCGALVAHRAVGRSGLRVSEIAYGGWVSTTEQSALEVARAALTFGVTTFDTADAYGAGRAETVLGYALRGVRRESVEICTKVYAPVGPGANDRGLSRKHILESVNGSLRRLQTDYIDVYQAHRFDQATPLEETLLAFNDLVRQGKVLYIGVSEWTPGQLAAGIELAAKIGLGAIVLNQLQYSMLWRSPEAELMPACQREGVGVFAWSPLAQGLLTGKYSPGVAAPEGSRAARPDGQPFIAGGLRDDVLQRVAALAPLAGELGLTLPQLAVAWVLRNPCVSSAVVGATNARQLAETVAASSVKLDDEVARRVDEVLGSIVERDPARIPSHPGDYQGGAAATQ